MSNFKERKKNALFVQQFVGKHGQHVLLDRELVSCKTSKPQKMSIIRGCFKSCSFQRIKVKIK